MYCFHASDPDSLPPPVAFSPPNAPPISAKESVTLYNFETIASHVYLCRKQDPTCSWSGNIHIHDSTVWSLGAKPLEGKEKNLRFVVWCWRRCRYFEYIHLEDIANILCEYRRAETLLHLVVPIDAFVKAGALQQVDNGSKSFPAVINKYSQYSQHVFSYLWTTGALWGRPVTIVGST